MKTVRHPYRSYFRPTCPFPDTVGSVPHGDLKVEPWNEFAVSGYLIPGPIIMHPIGGKNDHGIDLPLEKQVGEGGYNYMAFTCALLCK